MGKIARGAFAAALTVAAGAGGYEAIEAVVPGSPYYQQQEAAMQICLDNYPANPQIPIEELPAGCSSYAAHLTVVDTGFKLPTKAGFQHDAHELLLDQQAADRRLKLAGIAAGVLVGFSLGVAALTGEKRRQRRDSTTWLARRLLGPE